MQKSPPLLLPLLLLLAPLSPPPCPAATPSPPPPLNWPNRNPIGQIFLAYEALQSPTNPLGLMDPAPRIADALANLKIVHGQALIFWDADGLHGPHSAGDYKGDPRDIPLSLVKCFKPILDAGIRVGVTLRSDTDYVNHKSDPEHPSEKFQDRLAVTRAKVAAAKAMGVTLFYCDSSVGNILDVLAIVAAENPDCLFIPEERRPQDFRWGAPYMEFVPWSHCDTNYAVNPNAFTVLCLVGDVPERQAIPKYHDEVLQRLKKGDVPLFRAWFRGPEFIPMVKLLQEAGRPVVPLNPTALQEHTPTSRPSAKPPENHSPQPPVEPSGGA